MKTTAEKSTKTNKLAQAEAAFAQIIADASRRGFFGSVSLVLSVQDGHIQHVRVSAERMIK